MHTDLPDKLHCDKVVEIVNIVEYDSDAEENGDDEIGDGGGGGGASRVSDPTPGSSGDGKQLCGSDSSGTVKDDEFEEDEASLASTSRDDILDIRSVGSGLILDLVSMSPCPWSGVFS